MIRQIIQLTKPGVFLPRFVADELPVDRVLVRPTYLSVCAADQRYFTGDRPDQVLRNKLPMALLHEAVGEVLYDPAKKFSPGAKVVLVPCADEVANAGILPNYREKSVFYSSSCDGFAQEFLPLPHSQTLAIPDRREEKMYVFAEMVSVSIHAITRWRAARLEAPHGNRIGVWGDGPLGYILSLLLKIMEPNMSLTVFGKHDDKLTFFSFADTMVNVVSPPSKHHIDCAFECVGRDGAGIAIRDIIDRITPQGIIILLGVSERAPTMHTRMILEKGLCFIGCSRSSRGDFEEALRIMQSDVVHSNLRKIISLETFIRNANDLTETFLADAGVPFKTIMEWRL